MKVTDVVVQKNNTQRVSVFVDNEYAFSLDGADAILMKIKPGRELTKEDIEKCNYECNYTKARDKALEILSRKSVSKKELSDKLLEKGYDEPIVNDTISELENLGYVNDEDYASLFLEHCMQKMWGRKKIRFEMKQKGIPDCIIDEKLSEFDEDDILEEIKETVISKYGNDDLSDMKTKAKITRYLASRGFDFPLIDKVIRMSKEELSDE
ncbi:MAG: regulatory protein RecX [Ruminococcaceae bacterium]|nr:regulatory protein RecX [Oscillospiraceae bacterium]